MIETRIKRFGLDLKHGEHFDLIDPEDDPRYRDYVATYLEIAGRRGITPDLARTLVRTNSTVIAALAVRRGEADALICGLEGRFETRLRVIRDVIGLSPDSIDFAGMSLIRRRRAPSSSPTPMSARIRARRRSPTSPSPARTMSAVSVSRRRSRS